MLTGMNIVKRNEHDFRIEYTTNQQSLHRGYDEHFVHNGRF